MITGSFQARVQDLALGATITQTVTATSPAVAAPLSTDAAITIVPPRNNETWATPEAGGLLRSADDRVLLRVPPGAVTERTRFVYTPQIDVPVPLANLRAAFILEAPDLVDAAGRQFKPPLALTWADPTASAPLTLHYFDAAAQQWVALPTEQGPGAHQAQTTLPHLMLLAVTSARVSYGVQLLPSVRGFASDMWTGNSSVHYPLRLPPGPGGVDLALSLDYTSETVNSLRAGAGLGLDEGAAKSFSVQASIVGWGWQLNGKRRVREMHLVEVADLYGNRVTINYAREQRQVYCQAEGTDRPFYDRAIYPTSLAYYARNESLTTAVVVFGYNLRTDTRVTGWDNQCAQSLWSDVRLDNIYVQLRTGNMVENLTTIRHYQLTHTYLWYWDDPDNKKGLLLLKKITEYGREDGARPAWDFTYESPSWDWWNHTLLKTADNGQGGRVTYTYESAEVPIGGAACEGGTKRFRVQKLLTEDGLGQAAHNRSTTTYEYSNPQAWTTDPASAPTCRNRFEFLGHGEVQRKTQDGTGALLQTVVATFYQCHPGAPPASCTGSVVTLDPRKGKVYEQTTLGPAAQELARSRTDWATETVQGRTWVFQAAVTQWVDGGAPYRTEYAYLPAQQGGVQYGNLTHVYEYSDGGAVLYRTRETQYFPRNDPDAAYIINRPARQMLWDEDGACQGETRIWYDGNGAYTQAPIQGAPTKIQVAQLSCGGTWSETAYTYDAWGNRLTVTDPRGYTTTTVYDTGVDDGWPKLFAYPTSVTSLVVNGRNLTTHYVWDKLVGQVAQVIDPNNAVTSYSYDQWGRVTHVWQPGDDQANGHAATQVFTYSDYAADSGAPFSVHIAQQDDAGSGDGFHHRWTFYDGLGQVIQTQAEGAAPSQGVLTSTRYDALAGSRARLYPTSARPLASISRWRTTTPGPARLPRRPTTAWAV